MNIEGTYTFQAPPEEVWRLLTNISLLEHALPGIEKLERVGPDAYHLALQIQQAPLQGTYQGKFQITERQHPSHLSFVIESLGEQDTLSGIGTLSLQQQEQHTVITYKGSLHVGKRNSRLAPTVIKGAAKLLIQQSFALLSEQARASRNGHEAEKVYVKEHRNKEKSLADLTAAVRRKASWQTVAHRLRLGANDPVQEKIWGRRVKRASSAAGLLLLIWVGTRLPRTAKNKKQSSE